MIATEKSVKGEAREKWDMVSGIYNIGCVWSVFTLKKYVKDTINHLYTVLWPTQLRAGPNLPGRCEGDTNAMTAASIPFENFISKCFVPQAVTFHCRDTVKVIALTLLW